MMKIHLNEIKIDSKVKIFVLIHKNANENFLKNNLLDEILFWYSPEYNLMNHEYDREPKF